MQWSVPYLLDRFGFRLMPVFGLELTEDEVREATSMALELRSPYCIPAWIHVHVEFSDYLPHCGIATWVLGREGSLHESAAQLPLKQLGTFTPWYVATFWGLWVLRHVVKYPATHIALCIGDDQAAWAVDCYEGWGCYEDTAHPLHKDAPVLSALWESMLGGSHEVLTCSQVAMRTYVLAGESLFANNPPSILPSPTRLVGSTALRIIPFNWRRGCLRILSTQVGQPFRRATNPLRRYQVTRGGAPNGAPPLLSPIPFW